MLYIIIICGLLVDLGSKYIAHEALESKIAIRGDALFLMYLENTGIAFSIQIPSILLKIGTMFLIIGIFYYYKYERKQIVKVKRRSLLDISFGLILAGAIGNGVERVVNEKVVDFIGIKYFAVFNLADSFIFIGGMMYLFILYKKNLGVFDQE